MVEREADLLAHSSLFAKQGLVAEVCTADAALERARALSPDGVPPDLILLGSSAGPGGAALCRALRAEFSGPIVLLVNSAQESEQGISAGADDCVLRSVTSFGLLARVRALLGRSGTRNRIFIGKLMIDESYRRATVEGKPLALSDTEFGLLSHLAKQVGRTVPCTDLQNVLTGISPELASRGLEQRMSRLRTKLSRGLIQLQGARGVGYCLLPLSDARAAE